MEILNTSFDGLKVIQVAPYEDNRGYFERLFAEENFKKYDLHSKFVHINHSYNRNSGTFRGFHYQIETAKEIKVVKCISGSIIDFAIDMRYQSRTFLKIFEINLEEKKGNALYIPEGFAHGFLTTTDATSVIYLHSKPYNPNLERGLNYKDPVIDFGYKQNIKIVSEKDESLPFLTSEFKGIV